MRQLQLELEALRIKERARLAALGFRMVAIVAVVYFTAGALKVLAGQSTVPDVALRMLANESFGSVVAWVAGLGGVVYGWSERRLRHRDTKRAPRRSSSRLASQRDDGEDD